ncbi:MAG: cytochrome b N-terminal domain-containing protein, partial [Pseudomonadota bacterium]
IHILRNLYYGSYKSPRELLWWLGLVIFLTMMATAFMGYVLPWGQMSFWGATVITSLFGAFPVVGGYIKTWLWGGYSVDNPTLNRFFALHFLLPFVLIGIVILHIWALHQHGSNNPTGVDVKTPKDTVPFNPFYTIKDLFGMGVFLIIFSYLVFFQPNLLGDPDNYIPANPMSTPPHIVPEWYFLPFYAILRAVPSKLGGVLAMFGAIILLFFLPWLDSSKVRSATYRPMFRAALFVWVIDFLALGYLGGKPPEGMFVILGQIATVYYFFHFIALVPFICLVEKTLPLPESIDAATNKKG